MAQKRMFSLSVVDTDNFLEMPISSRLLYYELGMRADDDGFVDNWKKILLFTGLKQDDMKVLISKKFIIPFESGVIVIRHWRLNNYLQNDRTKPTIHQEELKKLTIDNNNVYTMDTDCIHSIDKNSIVENRIENKYIYMGVYKRVKLKQEQYDKLVDEFGKDYIDQIIEKLDEYVESNNNKNKYSNYNLVIRKAIREKWFNINKVPKWLNSEPQERSILTDEEREWLKSIE